MRASAPSPSVGARSLSSASATSVFTTSVASRPGGKAARGMAANGCNCQAHGQHRSVANRSLFATANNESGKELSSPQLRNMCGAFSGVACCRCTAHRPASLQPCSDASRPDALCAHPRLCPATPSMKQSAHGQEMYAQKLFASLCTRLHNSPILFFLLLPLPHLLVERDRLLLHSLCTPDPASSRCQKNHTARHSAAARSLLWGFKWYLAQLIRFRFLLGVLSLQFPLDDCVSAALRSGLGAVVLVFVVREVQSGFVPLPLAPRGRSQKVVHNESLGSICGRLDARRSQAERTAHSRTGSGSRNSGWRF